MRESVTTPCSQWAEKLATKYQDDLSYMDRLTMKEHLAVCPACATVHAAYKVMDDLMNTLPPVEPLPSLPYHLLQSELSGNPNRRSQGGIQLLLKPFVDMKLRRALDILLRPVYLFLNRRIAYATTNDHTLMALQNNGRSLLWQYKKRNVFFSSPAQENGVAYITVLDTQIFMFAAVMHLKPCGDSFLWKH